MFNKNYIMPRKETEFVPYEKTVTINRAPTDESVRLMKEFEEKALKKITDTYFVESSIAKGIVFETIINPGLKGTRYVVVFEINGKRHEVIQDFEEWKFKYRDTEATPAKIFAETIKNYLFNEILKGIKVVNY